MKHLFLLGIFISASHLSAQESRWGFGIAYGYESVGLTNIKSDLIESNNKGNWAPSVSISYKFHKHIRLSAGLGLRLLDYEIKDYTLNFGCDTNGNGGYDPFNSYQIASDALRAFTFSVNAIIYFGEKSNRFYLKPGLTFIKFIGDSPEVNLYECGDLTIGPRSSGINVLNSFQTQTALDIGYEFDLNLPSKFLQRLRFQIEYGASYFISPSFESRFTDSHFWSWGGSFGFRYDMVAACDYTSASSVQVAQ